MDFIPKLSFDDFCVIKELRAFFDSQGYSEVLWPEKPLNIMAACEDPETIATYNYNGEVWPLPQTQQMHLEVYLLKNPEKRGLHIQTTSYRNEPDPIPGRHDKIFPMYEFEAHGGIEALIDIEERLLKYLGFPLPEGEDHYPRVNYEDICAKYGVTEIGNDEEKRLEKDYGPVVFLQNFPVRSSPFWNMALAADGQTALKVDAIVAGVETIGSAERSCNVAEMQEQFESISGGGYARTLYAQFTKARVQRELNEFLSHKFIQRMGGGLGIRRLITALKAYGLYDRIVAKYQ